MSANSYYQLEKRWRESFYQWSLQNNQGNFDEISEFLNENLELAYAEYEEFVQDNDLGGEGEEDTKTSHPDLTKYYATENNQNFEIYLGRGWKINPKAFVLKNKQTKEKHKLIRLQHPLSIQKQKETEELRIKLNIKSYYELYTTN